MVKEQNEEIHALKKALNQFATKESTSYKADKSEIDVLTSQSRSQTKGLERVALDVENLREELDKKVSFELMERFATKAEVSLKADSKDVQKALRRKASKDTVEGVLGHAKGVDGAELTNILREKADKTLFRSLEKRLEKEIFNLRTEIGSCATSRAITPDLLSILEKKTSLEDVNRLLTSKMDRSEIFELLKHTADRSDVRKEIGAQAESIILEVRSALAKLQKEIVEVLNKKAYKTDVHRSLKRKADIADVERWLALKCDRTSLTDALEHKADVEMVQESLSLKVDRKTFVAEVLAEIERILAGKADMQDICSLLELKADSEDVDVSMRGMKSDFREKTVELEAALEALERRLVQVVTLGSDEAQDTHPCCKPIGRWIWRSGRLSRAGSIPWNVQSFCSHPDCLRWRQDSTAIAAVAPGLYEVSVGVFCEAEPGINLLLNGETLHGALTDGRKAGKACRPGLKTAHSVGNVAGWTYVTLVALPAEARLELRLDRVEEGSQAVLSIKKM